MLNEWVFPSHLGEPYCIAVAFRCLMARCGMIYFAACVINSEIRLLTIYPSISNIWRIKNWFKNRIDISDVKYYNNV